MEQLEKLEPIFGTLKKLRALIKEKGIAGYRGLLIDFLDYDQKISSCIDLAAKSKLFSIIVEDLDSAKEILALNQQLKGGVISIYPLSIIDEVTVEKQRAYPEGEAGVRPLTQYVRLKADADRRVAKLVHNLFSKAALVSNYPLAMRVAKEHNLTCITPELQIVYAGAFITQVGHYNRAQHDRVQLYQRAAGFERQLEEKAQAALTLERQKDGFNDKELEVLRKHQKCEVTISNLKGAYQQLTSVLYEIKNQIEHKSTHSAEVERQIQSYTAQERELKDQIAALE